MEMRRCCLILEDQALIGMSLEAYLEDEGFDIAGPFTAAAQALDWLTRETPALALLDVMLGDGSCVAVAGELKRRGVPFAVYSGLPPGGEVPPELHGVPWLEKPVSRETLTRTLHQLTRAAA
jgi:DNA-binding NtrC family response regulator